MIQLLFLQYIFILMILTLIVKILADGDVEGRAVSNLETGCIYTQGNKDTLTEYISKKLAKPSPKVYDDL